MRTDTCTNCGHTVDRHASYCDGVPVCWHHGCTCSVPFKSLDSAVLDAAERVVDGVEGAGPELWTAVKARREARKQ